MEEKFELQKYIFTDSRIGSVAQLLWYFDANKIFGINTYNNVEYYEIKMDNTDVTMLIFKEDYAKYIEQDKYSFLMLLYILQKSPILFQNKQNVLYFKKKDIVEMFNLSLKNFTSKDCINSLHKLLSLRITYDYTDSNGRRLRRISHLINSIDYDKENPERYCKITLSNWLKELFPSVDYINNKFYQGELDYTPFIKGNNKKTECMNLPQKFIELYRINQNKKNNIKVYKNEDYFQEIFNTNKTLRRKFIEGIVKNINIALEKSNIKIIFDCDFTPTKFKAGHFSIVPLDFEFKK